MEPTAHPLIPNRADTLRVLRAMGEYQPILMLRGDDDGYGTRWVLDGQQVQPVIAKYLMAEGLLSDSGPTEFGARRLALTEAGRIFRTNGVNWWSGLGIFQRVWVTLFG